MTVAPAVPPRRPAFLPMRDESVARGEYGAAERADRGGLGRRRQPEHDGTQHHQDQDREREERTQQHLEYFEPCPAPVPVNDREQRGKDNGHDPEPRWGREPVGGRGGGGAGVAACRGWLPAPASRLDGGGRGDILRARAGAAPSLGASDGGSCKPPASFSASAASGSCAAVSLSTAVLCEPASTNPVVSTTTFGAVANCHVTPNTPAKNSAGISVTISWPSARPFSVRRRRIPSWRATGRPARCSHATPIAGTTAAGPRRARSPAAVASDPVAISRAR